jgi:hypothetical protein
MSRQSVQLVLCDVHLGQGGQEVAADFSSVVQVAGVTRLLELCPEHRAALIGDLPDKLRRYGQPADSLGARRVDRRARKLAHS